MSLSMSRKIKEDMPDDFWPEILVTAKYMGTELSFVLTEDTLIKGLSVDDLDILRKCLWGVVEQKIDRKRILS